MPLFQRYGSPPAAEHSSLLEDSFRSLHLASSQPQQTAENNLCSLQMSQICTGEGAPFTIAPWNVGTLWDVDILFQLSHKMQNKILTSSKEGRRACDINVFWRL